MSENGAHRDSVAFVNGELKTQEAGFTGAQLATAYKVAYQDFILGKTSRASLQALSTLLAGALNARKQQLAEENKESSHRLSNYF